MQGKLQGRLLDFSTPQPIDECLAILGESMVREKEVTAVMGVYAKAVKDGDVSPFTSPHLGVLDICKSDTWQSAAEHDLAEHQQAHPGS